ncbi:mediator of RNA polymerase II transcription subunit 11 [Malassezia restricta]|uniref:mediator of RNA polymerase II transcription subunit 11 n=1 Tax=Malassezia restricta TaxID=76775 RepID=UPI000DD1660B|nr:mediator of RNA polymerase II transcription subunit 11 [Malassezia restricta]AXA51534.1 mediator of RNA polymerase II transcription subunit 11 [Malassezia restricta]
MDDARAASPASEAGTADELLDRLLQCDAQLVELLRTASRAMLALSDESPATSSEDDMTQWFATLHDIQITLRHAAHALRQARLPPVLSPAAAQARLRGEVGVAGLSHTQTSSAPYSLSTLRLRECAWRRVAESLARAHHDAQAPLVASLARGASLASDT